MKPLLIILFSLFFAGLFSQVNPPKLHCTEVLTNGDVKLIWTPPADPSNEFANYEVYFATQKTGPYALVSTALSTLSQTNYVHTTTVSLIQSCYFYMVSRYGPGASSTSISSDTIPTIYLVGGSGSKTWDLKISYLPLVKNPAPRVYTLLKEYPLGTWNNLATTTSTIYPDTLSGCVPMKINYQVTLPNTAGGCLFVSNLAIGTALTDTKDPEQPYVDSISVLPNGNVAIGWQVPVDKDITHYKIQYRIFSNQVPQNQNIDSLPGRTTTSYVYATTTANSQTVGLFVKAIDSCSRGSSVYDLIKTMFLTTAYDRCAYKTVLNWNRYRWAEMNGVTKESTLEYRIYYSVNGSNFIRIDSTSDTTYVHTNVEPGKNICYFVRVINVGKTITASSNRACFFSGQVNAPQFVYLKTASVINKSTAEVKVLLDSTKVCKGLSIQRSEDGIDFTEVGFVPHNGSPHYSFIDDQVKSDLYSYSYRASIIDSCGNLRGVSAISKTILLKIQEDGAELFTKHLSWTNYQGFGGGIGGYSVYRIVNDALSGGPIGYTDALTTSYTDNLEEVASQGAKIEYMVQAVEGLGNPYGIQELSNSNPVSVYEEGRLFVPNAFAPGGVNKIWKPVTHFIEKTEYKVSVFNRWGKKVFESSDDVTGWDGENCIADVYVYLIDYKNARGEYKQLKGTVSLLR